MHFAFGRVRRRIALLRASFLLMTGVYLEMVLWLVWIEFLCLSATM